MTHEELKPYKGIEGVFGVLVVDGDGNFIARTDNIEIAQRIAVALNLLKETSDETRT